MFFFSSQIISCPTTTWTPSLSTSLTFQTRRSWHTTSLSWRLCRWSWTTTLYTSSTTRWGEGRFEKQSVAAAPAPVCHLILIPLNKWIKCTRSSSISSTLMIQACFMQTQWALWIPPLPLCQQLQPSKQVYITVRPGEERCLMLRLEHYHLDELQREWNFWKSNE